MVNKNKHEPAVEICDIKKSFIIPKYNNNSLKQIIVNGFKRNEKQARQVLDGINVTINKGDFFGIVGRNGSGKSTLLKLICGVYAPDYGEIKLHGNLTPFIELGVGFNPELSGRDNVFLNGALLGFSRQQMNEMYDEIVEFAELEEFMDLKLKNYSSGMQVRLAFSIAIKAKNDILIFDEVLAVGDEAFQRKCMRIFEDYKKNGQTVVLVTHDMSSVSRFCNNAIMIDDGKVVASGSPEEVANAYKHANISKEKQAIIDKNKNSGLEVSGYKDMYKSGESMDLNISWDKKLTVGKVGVAIFGPNNEYIFGSNTGRKQIKGCGVKHSVDLLLGPGSYYVTIAIYDKEGNLLVAVNKVFVFLIHDDFNPNVDGLTRMNYRYY